MYQTDPPLPAKETLPTMYDLPSEDPQEPGVPDEFHLFQPRLLQETFCPPNYPVEQVFTASDLNLYYDVRHPLWYKRPDWFAVVGISKLYEEHDLRLSYVIWQEEVAPLVVVELLSPGTETEDLGQTTREINQPPTKWSVYEQILRVPYYVVFDRYTNQLQAFQLIDRHYQKLLFDGSPIWIAELELGLGLWYGRYQGVERLWLRWCDGNANWIPTPVEAERSRAEAERSRAEAEHSRAEAERLRAERLAERLRSLGVDPNQL
jgi:Uma2 family endonuclease